MNILDEILSELQGIRAALESSAGAASSGSKGSGSKGSGSKQKEKEPEVSLEDVQNKIRALAESGGDPMKTKIKAAIEALGAKRAGDLEGDPAKLAKLSTALEALESAGGGSDDDDLL